MPSAMEQTAVGDSARECGFLDRIPVRNIWLLMFYASDLVRLRGHGGISVEEMPDDIPDLVAEILSRIVKRRLERNLSYGYQSKKVVLGCVRGRIELLETERRQLLSQGRIACRFDDLTVDTPRNRFVRAALDVLAGIVSRPELAHACRTLAGRLTRLGVGQGRPSRSELSMNRFGRHDSDDQQMLAAAQLAFDLALPTEKAGGRRLALPDREIGWVRLLYEKAVAGFYDLLLPRHGWTVEAGKKMDWPIDAKSSGIERILPSMRTDIILENRSAGRRVVIDTKFNAITVPGYHGGDTLRSGHIYQIYAYLRSQERPEAPLSLQTSGLLLHPSVGTMVDESAVIQGHEIRFATVDLAGTDCEIRAQLLRLVGL